jgi:hypothetical protein
LIGYLLKVLKFGSLLECHQVRSIRASEVSLKIQDVLSSNCEMSILNIRTLLLDVAAREYLLYITVGSTTPGSDSEQTGFPTISHAKYFTPKDMILKKVVANELFFCVHTAAILC